MSKSNTPPFVGLGIISIFAIVIFFVFSNGIDNPLIEGTVAQLSFVESRNDISCDAWNELSTIINGQKRVVASNHQGFNPLVDSGLLSITDATANVDALNVALILQCDGNFIEHSSSTTVTGGLQLKLCGSQSPEKCYKGQDRFFSSTDGVASFSNDPQFVELRPIKIQEDQRIELWSANIGESDILALDKLGSITFTSRMYPDLTFTFDNHNVHGTFTATQDSTPQTGTGDLIYSQYGGVNVSVPPPPDSDGDGIDDTKDQCTGQPEDFNGFEDEDGCPDADKLIDTDGDGIRDTVDECPSTTVNESVNDVGCSQTQLELDTDGDGVPDLEDACPSEFGLDGTGCDLVCTDIGFVPVCGVDDITYPNSCFAINQQVEYTDGECDTGIVDLDTDNDGILDSNDLCQGTLPNVSVDSSGCALPITGDLLPDFDGDGILDIDDDCPASGGNIDQFGCPIDQSSQSDTTTIIGIFEDIITPTPTPTNNQPSTTTSGSSFSGSEIIDGLPDSITLMAVALIIIIVIVIALLKSGKAKL